MISKFLFRFVTNFNFKIFEINFLSTNLVSNKNFEFNLFVDEFDFESNFEIQFLTDEFRVNLNFRTEFLIDATRFKNFEIEKAKSLNNEIQRKSQVRISIRFDRFFADFSQMFFFELVSSKSFKFENSMRFSRFESKLVRKASYKMQKSIMNSERVLHVIACVNCIKK